VIDTDAARAVAESLEAWANAYPVSMFPVPPEDERAKDSRAADVMREMACPQFATDAALIRSLCDALDEANQTIEAMGWDLVEMDELNNMGDR
jgi:hypothetical protein